MQTQDMQGLVASDGKYIYLSIALKYNFEVFVFEKFQFQILLLLLHYISDIKHALTTLGLFYTFAI